MSYFNYNRLKTKEYAKKFAYKRNPKFYAFDYIGGDCTNFVSQCIYAGCKVMNYAKTFGWYYNSLSDRSPSWSGVEFLYNFITTNKGVGPYGELVNKSDIDIGDVIELGNENGKFYHSAIITKVDNGNIFVASHNRDGFDIPLSNFYYAQIRYIAILGAKK